MRAACRPRLRFMVALGLLAFICLLPSASALADTTPNPPAPYLDPANASKLLALVQDKSAWQDAEASSSGHVHSVLSNTRLAAIRASLPDPKNLSRNKNRYPSGSIAIKEDTAAGWKWAAVDAGQSEDPIYVIQMDGGLGTAPPFTTGHGQPGSAYWQYIPNGTVGFLEPVPPLKVSDDPIWAATFSGTDDSVDWQSISASLVLNGGCGPCLGANTFTANVPTLADFSRGFSLDQPADHWCAPGAQYPWIGPSPAWGYPCVDPNPPIPAQTWSAHWMEGSGIANDPIGVSTPLPYDGHATYFDQFSASANLALNWDLAAARTAIGSDTQAIAWVNCELTQGPTTTACVQPTLRLSPPSLDTSPFTAESVSFTVSVGNVSDATGTPLTATITGANPQVVSVTVSGATATFSYTGQNPGADNVRVSGTIAGQDVSSNSVSLNWLAGSNSLPQTFGLPGTSLYARSATQTWADPVDSETGNFYQSAADVELSGDGISFSLTRTYNSRDEEAGVLGKGWSASLHPSLSTDSEGNVSLKAGDGQEIGFALQPDGSYEADSDVSASLTKTASGYDLLLHNQDVQHFNSTGKLATWLDQSGQGLHFAYGDEGQLVSVTDADGREADLDYDSQGHLTKVSLPDRTTLAYGYDGDLLTSSTDQAGAVTRYAYDGNGYLESVTDPTGKLVFKNTYDNQGRVLTQADALGNVNTFDWSGGSGVGTDAKGAAWKDVYNDDGQLSERIDPLGNDAHYVYDDANNLVSTTDALGDTSAETYDERGNVLTSTDALGNTESWTYDKDNNVTSHTDQLGHVTRFTYDSNGNLLTETDPTGAVTTNKYDSAGRLVSTTDPLGRTSWSVYDESGNEIEAIAPSGAETTMRYDSLGQEVAETDPLGNTTTYTYDSAGRLIKTTDSLGHSTTSTYDAAGDLVAKTDANGNTTRYVYDEAGHQVAVIAPDGSATRSAYDSVDNLISNTDALGNVTQYIYDAAGRQIASISPTGERTTTTYDANGDVIAEADPLADKTATVYDALGREISTTDPLGRTAKTAYDAAGNVVATIDPLGNTTTSTYDAAGREIKETDPLGHSTTSTYDVAGHLISKTDANGHTTRYGYDADGQKVSVTEPDGSVTRYAYDAAGNLIRRTDANGNVTTYSYDAVGEKTQVVNPLGSRWTYSYDANGNLVKTVTAIGNANSHPGVGTIKMTYDSQNDLTWKSYSDGTPSVSYAYDSNGTEISMADGTGKTTFAYDPNGRLIAVSGPNGRFLYRYDEDGNLLSRTYPNGLETTYGYDSAGQTVMASVNGETTRYTYDANGNLASILHPNGILDTRSYDAAGRITDINGKASDGKPFYSRAYTYDPVGNPLTLTASSTRKRVSAWRGKGKTLSQWKESYSYDSNDRLTRACMNASCSRYFTYSYDPVGNRKQLQAEKGTTRYSYDVADELLSTSDGRRTLDRYSYDPNGNELSDGSSRYAYNLENELTQVTGEGEKVSYTYTGDGLMATRSAGDETTRYTWDTNSDLGELALETDSKSWDKLMGRDTTAYAYGVDPLGIVTKGGSYTFHTDSLGSVVELSDAHGKLVGSYRYTPFGESYRPSSVDHANSGSSLNPIRFTGQYLDSASGLYNMRARDYDPETGRFLQTDPQECSGDCVSSYVYADDQPTLLLDPSGEKAMGAASVYAGPKKVYVTFFVYGFPKGKIPSSSNGLWKWESINGSRGSGAHFICGWNPSSSTPIYKGGGALPWVYDDTSNSHRTRQRESTEVRRCATASNAHGRKKSGYEYMAPYWTRRFNPGGVVKRFYAELYNSSIDDPSQFLRSWTYSKGSPVVSANNNAVGTYAKKVCSKLKSGGWMGIWNLRGWKPNGEAYRQTLTNAKLTAIDHALDRCTS